MIEHPLRIMHVVGGAGLGGIERHVADLASAQADLGHRVTVVAHPSILGPINDNVRKVELDLSRSRHRPGVILALRHRIKAERPDIVHAHASKAARLTRSACFMLRSAPVSIATAHGLKSNNRPYRNHTLIAVSNAAAKKLSRPDATVIPNGIEPAPTTPNAGKAYTAPQTGFDGTRPIALAVGRLAPVKGYDVLLHAWREIDAHLALVGDGPERATLESLAHKLNLNDRVRFLGWRTDVPALLPGADLMVMSSRREGFPYTLVEALHAGVPVVATRVGALGELLPSAALAEPENADSLQATLSKSIADPEALRALFAPVFAKARIEFTLAHMTERTLDVYSAALSSRAR